MMVACAAMATTAGAGEMVADQHGVLNPSEYTLEQILLKVEYNDLSEIECIYGYEVAKHGMHEPARVIIRHCAEDKQLTQAMTFMAWMDANGYALAGGPDLASAARWDRRAADLGDSNAQFNYGVTLLIGRGVDQDAAEGRRYIDLAAANGDESAKALAAARYDVSTVVGLYQDRLSKLRRRHHGETAAAAETH